MKKLLVVLVVIAAAALAIHAEVGQRQISQQFRGAVIANANEHDDGLAYGRLLSAARTRKDHELLAKFAQLAELDVRLRQAGRDEADAYIACDQQKQCTALHRVEAEEEKMRADQLAITTDLRHELGLGDLGA